MPLAPGTTLAPYSVTAQIGAGGMGVAWRARDTKLDRTVAINVLPEHVAADPDLKQRFEREARTGRPASQPSRRDGSSAGTDSGMSAQADPTSVLSQWFAK